jgi:hypothetical protein
VIIEKSLRTFLQSLNPSKASTAWELKRRHPCGLGAFQTIRPMLLRMHVVRGGRRLGRRLMVMIGSFLADASTVCFAHGSRGCVGAEQRD